MTENEAKEKYNLLTKEVESLHLQAARKEQERDIHIKEWQKICVHDFSEPQSVYGYGLCRECKKCQWMY
jgi:hypothetical protein